MRHVCHRSAVLTANNGTTDGAALNDGLHLRTSAPCGEWESNADSSVRYSSACMCIAAIV